MKLWSSAIALALAAMFIILAAQNYALDADFLVGYHCATGIDELVIFGLGLVSLRIVRKRSARRQNDAMEPLAVAWLGLQNRDQKTRA